MGVTQCRLERHPSAGSFDERNLGEYTLRYRVDTDDPLMDMRMVANGALTASPHPLPPLWSSYSFLGLSTDATSFSRKYTIKPEAGSQLKWMIDVSYTPLQPGEQAPENEDPGTNDPNPLLRPAVWGGGGGEAYTRQVEQDKDGAAIVNAAGQPYDPGIQREEAHSIIVATKNLGTLADVLAAKRAWTNAVNSGTWNSLPARTVWCKLVEEGELTTEGAFKFFPVTWHFVIREDGKTWDDELLEQGYSHLAGGQLVSNDPYEAALLNAQGGLLAAGGAAVYTAWRTLREKSFGALPF